jgi:hypothetical protein
VMDAREFFEFNKDNSLKRDRSIVYFATGKWEIEAVWESLQYIQNRPTWNYNQVRATILTWWWFHPGEIHKIKCELMNSRDDQPLVVMRLINLERSLEGIMRKFKG